MSGKVSAPMSTSSKGSLTTTAASSHTVQSRRRVMDDFLVIWLDSSTNELNTDYQNMLAQLRTVVNNVSIFTDPDECVDFLTEDHGMKVFLILKATIKQQIGHLIYSIYQLDSIYIFSNTKSVEESSVNKWTKIKGVYTDIMSLCGALQKEITQHNRNSIAISFVTESEVTSGQNLDQLEPSFMYTQIIKEILLEMEYNEQSIENLVQFWRNQYIDNIFTMRVIDEFVHDYCSQSSIKWYTREQFIYQILNQALRTLETDTMINMGFFIRDLHQELKKLHQKQIDSYSGKSFTVYRGQGLSTMNFEKLLKAKGGLMSFNNFLSTSLDRNVSLLFADSVSEVTDMVGILFKMTINPNISSAVFASIREVSYFRTEEEILFSMHTVFRVGEITKIDNSSPLYEVNLTLTADDDQQLRTLTEHIEEEIEAQTGWERLSMLLLKIGHFNKAEELYDILLEQTSDQHMIGVYYHQQGSIKSHQGDYKKAIEYHEKALEIIEKTPLTNPLHLATAYNNIGAVYHSMEEYSTALSFYEKAHEILRNTFPSYHSTLAGSYHNIGLLYVDMGEYSKVLAFYEKSSEIQQKNLPPNHPSLASAYNNIGLVYLNSGEYSKALSYYEKAIQIFQKTLPSNHHSLGTSYNNIAGVYYNMREYSKALAYYERAQNIWRNSLPLNHPNIQTVKDNIEYVKEKCNSLSDE